MTMSNSQKLMCGMTIAAMFALSTPAYSAADAGKATYDISCINCHGKAGAGNNIMDKFWQVRIPRLDGEYVQKKSDDEIKSVILNGVRKMPPAVQGHPHDAGTTKVRPEQVPDLIAYLRSLKKK
jgi:mono/diheme cytochrome c family protein